VSGVPWLNWITLGVSVTAVVLSRRYALMARRALQENRAVQSAARGEGPGV
jgi:hypothetical protein